MCWAPSRCQALLLWVLAQHCPDGKDADFLSGFQVGPVHWKLLEFHWLLQHCWGQDLILGLKGQPPVDRIQGSQEQVLGKVCG